MTLAVSRFWSHVGLKGGAGAVCHAKASRGEIRSTLRAFYLEMAIFRFRMQVILLCLAANSSNVALA
jgi:hypothetical protein